MRAPITIDFETKPIAHRPDYPPEPVGVAVWDPGRKPKYLAWGHEAGENNTTKRDARRELQGAWKSGRPLLFHNAQFDLDIAEEFFDLPVPPWHMFFDSMIEAFLYDPNEQELGLKEQAEMRLDMPPEERDAVRDWLYQNIPGLRRLKKRWAAHIWRAPGAVVAPYAIGDVVRTRKLHDFFMPWIIEEGVGEAYDRERRLLPILIEMGREGIPVAADRLAAHIEKWEDSIDVCSRWLRRKLRAPKVNLNSNEELADALERAKLVREWVMTPPSKTYPEGQRSVSMDNLMLVCEDPEVAAVLRYRSSLGHALKNNARPWLDMSQAHGKIYTIWNQVRQQSEEKRKAIGARTGRASTTPNTQNVAKKPTQICFSKAEQKSITTLDDEAKTLMLPRALAGKIEPLPWMRDYIIAPKGRLLIDRDYSQQELRILAHFMEGDVLGLYRKTPYVDFHQLSTDGVNRSMQSNQSRGVVKQIVLGIIYARGIPAIAEQLGIPEEQASNIRAAIKKLFPGVEDLIKNLKGRARLDEPIRTWGGRLYYVEPPAFSKKFNRFMTFEYKLINTLIQGSAADNTKEAMIRYHEVAKEGQMILQVHDELMAHCPKKAAVAEMRILRDAMDSVEFDVPMKTDGTWGPTWGQLVDFDKAGEEVWQEAA